MEQKYLEAAQSGDSAECIQNENWESCFRIAEKFYAQGDYKKAFAWYKKASERPGCNPIVFFELGYLFQHGEGVASDNIEALKWYEKAALLEVPQAMYNLAYFYQNGIVVDRDIPRAAQLLREATALMERLQLERDSYDAWKTEHDAQLAQARQDAEEKRVRSEDLELRNRELGLELSAIKREFQRLETESARQECALQESKKQYSVYAARAESAEDALRREQESRKEVEITASARQSQMEEQLHAADELIANLVRKHNESFEHVQSSYTAQIDRVQCAYETSFTELQRTKEQLDKQNANLTRMLNSKTSELSTLQKTLQQSRIQLESEQKKKKIASILAGTLGVLIVIFIIL